MRTQRPFLVRALVSTVTFLPLFVAAQTLDDAQRAALQAQLAQVQTEIQQNQVQLEAQQKQRTSYERDVAILDSQIQQAQLQIKQRDLTIKQLKNGIATQSQGISALDVKVGNGEDALAQILRLTQQIDDTSFAELALGNSLNDALQDLDDFERIRAALGTSFTTMAAQRSDLSARKQDLEDKQQEEQDLLRLQVLQQNSLKNTEQQKQKLVAQAKGQEAAYTQLISDKQQTAAQIQAQLFALNNANQTTSFGDMYKYAKEASLKTGVRPAVILGILSEESNLGQNVGTGNWKIDMKAPRDTVPFQQICASLGLNPDAMPVSATPGYGYGGAMGPAQFIPSTWVLYQDRIAQASGQQPPNPWDPRTAAFAAAILMQDNGADAQTPAAERLAALRYLAGWKNAGKAAYAFYGDDVMALADKFQAQINILGR